MNYQSLIKSLVYIKDEEGASKAEALDYLEFDSDVYPDPEVLNNALNEVYGV